MNHEQHITPSNVPQLNANVEGNGVEPSHSALSNRETQVMGLLAAGKTVKEVSKELGLGVKTVSTYRGRVLEKLKLKNIPQLMRYAVQKGLIPDKD